MLQRALSSLLLYTQKRVKTKENRFVKNSLYTVIFILVVMDVHDFRYAFKCAYCCTDTIPIV